MNEALPKDRCLFCGATDPEKSCLVVSRDGCKVRIDRLFQRGECHFCQTCTKRLLEFLESFNAEKKGGLG